MCVPARQRFLNLRLPVWKRGRTLRASVWTACDSSPLSHARRRPKQRSALIRGSSAKAAINRTHSKRFAAPWARMSSMATGRISEISLSCKGYSRPDFQSESAAQPIAGFPRDDQKKGRSGSPERPRRLSRLPYFFFAFAEAEDFLALSSSSAACAAASRATGTRKGEQLT